MNLFRFFPVMMFVSLTALRSFAVDDSISAIIDLGQKAPKISIQSLGDVPSSEVTKVIREAQSSDLNTIVTSDHPEVLNLTANAYDNAKNRKKLKFMPLGILTEMSKLARTEFKDYLARAQDTVRSDKVTLIVLAITTATDSLIWIHATSIGFPQKLSMVSLNMLFAVTFGLDRDMWGKMTSPIQNKMMLAFERLGTTSETIKTSQTLASQFVSNLAMGSAFYLLRTGLLSVDHLQTVLATTDFWAHTMKLTSMMTLTQFAWSEVYSKVDVKVNPVAKLNLKRITDLRGIVLTSLASISMVLQPEIYGNTPIFTFAIHGMIGIGVLLSLDRVVQFLETSRPSVLLYKYSTQFEDVLNGQSPVKEPRLCRQLFAS